MVSFEERGSAKILTRYQRSNSVTLTARLVGGYTLDSYDGPIPLGYERTTHTPTYMNVEFRWYSKLPARLSMVTNITRVFDPPTWLWTFIMAFVGFAFLLIIIKKTKVSPGISLFVSYYSLERGRIFS